MRVSITNVATRFGHASITTTQKTSLQIIRELENQDVDFIMRSLVRSMLIPHTFLAILLPDKSELN